jgi:hypothetical protein
MDHLPLTLEGSEGMGRFRPISMMSIRIVEEHFHGDYGIIVKNRFDLDCGLLRKRVERSFARIGYHDGIRNVI